MMWMILAGASLGLAAALIMAATLGSWLVFAVLVVPFMFLGGVAGILYEWQAMARDIIADPQSVDREARYLATKRNFRQAANVLLHAASTLRNSTSASARLSAEEQAAMQAHIQRWTTQARHYIELDIADRRNRFFRG